MAFKFKGLRALRMFNNGRIVGGHHYVFKAKMYIVTKKKFHKISTKGMIYEINLSRRKMLLHIYYIVSKIIKQCNNL